jgi:hypothetical protein
LPNPGNPTYANCRRAIIQSTVKKGTEMAKKYRVMGRLFLGEIFVGRTKKDGRTLDGGAECMTSEVLRAVVDYLSYQDDSKIVLPPEAEGLPRYEISLKVIEDEKAGEEESESPATFRVISLRPGTKENPTPIDEFTNEEIFIDIEGEPGEIGFLSLNGKALLFPCGSRLFWGGLGNKWYVMQHEQGAFEAP